MATNKLIDLSRLSRFWDKVKNYIDTNDNAIVDKIYPVGSIYMSVTDSTVASVQARFGGTWERISEGKALFGYSTTDPDFQTIGSGGGNKVVDLKHCHTVNSHSHTIDNQSGNTGAASGNTDDCTLNINQIPSHNHDLTSYFFDGTPSAGTYGLYGSGNYKFYLKNTTTGYKGGTKPHHHGLGSHKHSIPKNTDSSSPSTDNKLSTTQNIMNPYITVYMYKRTA